MIQRSLSILVVLVAWVAPAAAQDRIVFTMGQLAVFARAADTHVTVTNLADGEVYAEVDLAQAGERWQQTSGVPNYVAVSSNRPVTLFTGKALAGRDDWMSLMNSDNDTEFGTVFHGFTEHHLWVFVPRAGPDDPVTVEVVDQDEGDDSHDWAVGDALFANERVAVFYAGNFDDDPLVVRCSSPCVAQVGASSIHWV